MSLKAALQALIRPGILKRWTPAQLAAQRHALESELQNKPVEVALALEASEYLIQRYLPAGSTVTQAQFARFQAKAKRLLSEAEAAGELTEEALERWRTAEVERGNRRQELLRSSYHMDQDDFFKVIGVLLSAAQLPKSARLLKRLFHATDGAARDPAAARDDRNDESFSEMVTLTWQWRNNYQLLRCAQNADYPWIKVSPTRRCGCRVGAPHRAHRTEDMLRAFETGHPAELIYPSPCTLCLAPPIQHLCEIHLHPQSDDALRIDPEFERGLDEMASRRSQRQPPSDGNAS